MRNRFNILIFGCGNIGFRHFQGLLKNNQDMNIYLYDTNNKYKKKFIDEFKKVNYKNKSVHTIDSLKKKNKLDLIIMATPSKNRLNSIIEIIKYIKVKFFLIEKVIFQKVADHKKIIDIFKNKKIKAWINCPRRYWDNIENLKKNYFYLNDNSITVEGSEWKITSNAIHFLDLFEYFNNNSIKLVSSKLSNNIRSTERNGYFNCSGKIKFIDNCNNKLSLNETIKKKDLIIKIRNKKIFAIINQTKESCSIYSLNTKKLLKRFIFQNYYQSEVTDYIVSDILNFKKTKLLDFEKSLFLSSICIHEFNLHFTKIFNRKVIACPIT